jgi:hypothetical protein
MHALHRPILAVALALAGTALAPALTFARPSPAFGGDMAGRLMEADANHDGLVSRAEFHLWRQSQFLRIDRNGDGFLSREDVPALLSGRVGPRLDALVEAFDTDGDHRVSRAEFVEGPTPASIWPMPITTGWSARPKPLPCATQPAPAREDEVKGQGIRPWNRFMP